MDKKVLFNIEKIIDSLPHGSGIDCDWNCEIKNNKIILSNSFHLMNDLGFYICYCDFYIIIDVFDALSFKLKFNGNHYYVNKYDLRSYLDDVIYSYIEMM